MKTLIIFSSSHGTTEKAAQLLKEQLIRDVELVNLKKFPNRQIVKKVAGVTSDVSTINADEIKRFAENFNNIE